MEVLGHRRIAGRCSESRVAGAAFVRVDVYRPGDDAPHLSQFYAPSSIFSLTPATEEVCRRLTAYDRPAPVSRYELPAPAPGPARERAADGDDEPLDEDDYYP